MSDSDKSASELMDYSLLKQLKGNFKGSAEPDEKDVSGQCAFQFMLPDWIYKEFFEPLQKIPGTTVIGIASFALFMAVLGISMMFSKVEWTRMIGVCVLVFLASLLLGLAGSWILVQEVYKQVVFLHIQK